MEHYLTKYVNNNEFNVPAMINDDFFEAIKLCFNAKKYISCAKLLVSFIDTIGFIKYGNDNRAFKKWLDDYVDLAKLGITSDELWEHRNSLLHMSTLESKKVLEGKFPILMAYVGRMPEGVELPDGYKGYNLNELIGEITKGISRFIEDFIAAEPELFMSRYDLILSDHRYDEYHY